MSVEEILVNHCGPVLLCKKPSSAVSVPHNKTEDILKAAYAICTDIKAEVLIRRPKCDLILIYRTDLLEETLNCFKASRVLKSLGYPITEGLCKILEYLKKRLSENEDFPHEIGFFLGYPTDDVLGFIDNNGHNYKHCGLWKVYGDVSYAKTLFCQYKECKNCLSNYIKNGGSLYNLPAEVLAG